MCRLLARRSLLVGLRYESKVFEGCRPSCGQVAVDYDDATNTLLGLLSGPKRPNGRSILITGPWGCGKTFLWKQTLAPRIGRPTIYVSAFGSESSANLKGRLIAHVARLIVGRAVPGALIHEKAASLVAKFRERTGRLAKVFESSVNSIGGTLLRRADIDPLELADLVPEETIICFDDIERVSSGFKIEDLLGVVNILSEHKNIDVVVICNEEHITAGANGDAYLKYKEKAISTEIRISADPSLLFDRVATSVVGPEVDPGHLQAVKPIVLDVFQRAGSRNLRLLARVCARLDTIHAAGVSTLSPAEVRFLTAVTLYDAAERPRNAEFLNFNAMAIQLAAQIDHPPKTQPDPKRVEQSRFLDLYFGESDYEFHQGIFDLIRNGYIDRRTFVRPSPPELTGAKKSLSIVFGGAWRQWNDAAIADLVATLSGHIRGGEVANPREVFDCLCCARFLADIVAVTLDPATTTAAKEHLERMAAAQEVFRDHEWEMQVSDLMPLVKPEYDHYLECGRSAKPTTSNCVLQRTHREGRHGRNHQTFG
jgi:hypothetical protein